MAASWYLTPSESPELALLGASTDREVTLRVTFRFGALTTAYEEGPILVPGGGAVVVPLEIPAESRLDALVSAYPVSMSVATTSGVEVAPLQVDWRGATPLALDEATLRSIAPHGTFDLALESELMSRAAPPSWVSPPVASEGSPPATDDDGSLPEVVEPRETEEVIP